jgi:Flp pilus assembly protein TadG
MMRRRCYRAGAAAVEFALVAPLFTLLILGAVELGRALQVQAALDNAVREGCRGFAESTTTLSSGQVTGTAAYAQYVVLDSLSNASMKINTANVTVTAVQSSVTVSGLALTEVTVTATLPYSTVAYVTPVFVNRNLSATVSMLKN